MKHLTKEQKYTISCLLKQGLKQKEIADIIGKDKSVINRELKRNQDLRSGKYCADLAQRKYRKRQTEKSKGIQFTNEIRTN